MNKEFIPYEEALDLKKLGFDEPCFGHYVDGELRGIDLGMEELGGVKPYYQRFGFHVLNNHDIDNPSKVVVTAPTYSQAFRWFRDKHNLGAIVSQFGYAIENQYGQATKFEEDKNYLSYEESELECLKKLIAIKGRKGREEVECSNCGSSMSLLPDDSVYVCSNSECTSCYEDNE